MKMTFKYIIKIILFSFLTLIWGTVFSKSKVIDDPIIYERVTSKITKAIANHKSYLIDVGNLSTYTENWRNGGKSFISATDKQLLEKNLNTFNETYKKEGVKCYLVVGRYIVDYERFTSSKYYQDDSVLTNLEGKLKDRLTNKTTGSAAEKNFDPERFMAFLDRSFKDAKSTTAQSGNQKTIILFYIETVEVTSGLAKDKIDFNTKYYCFAKSDKENELETQKIAQFGGFLKTTYPGFGTMTTSETDAIPRIKLLSQTTEGIARLWSNEGDNFTDTYGYERLKIADIKELPEWAIDHEGNRYVLDDISKAIAEAKIEAHNAMSNLFGKANPEQETAIRKQSKIDAIMALQEIWISEHFNGLGSIVIDGHEVAKLEDLIPVWSSGRRAYYYYQMAKANENSGYRGAKYDNYIKAGTSGLFFVLDVIPMAKLATIIKSVGVTSARAIGTLALASVEKIPQSFTSAIRNSVVVTALTASTLFNTEIKQVLRKTAESTLRIEISSSVEDLGRLASRNLTAVESATSGFTKLETKTIASTVNFAEKGSLNAVIKPAKFALVKYVNNQGSLFILQASDVVNASVLFISIVNDDIIKANFGKDFEKLPNELPNIPKTPGNDDKDKGCTICINKSLSKSLCDKLLLLATRGNNRPAVEKLCANLSTNLESIVDKLLTLKDAEIVAFLSDVLNVPTGCNGTSMPENPLPTNIGSLTTAMVDAWRIYNDAGRTCLKLSTSRMKDLANAVSDNKLGVAPYLFNRDNFVGMARAGGSANNFAAKFDNTVFTNLVKFAGVSATYQNIDKLKAKLSQQNSGATLEGTNFIVKYMGEHASEFDGGNYIFEAYDNVWARYVDVEDRRDNAKIIYYEFKSVQDISATDFITQFVKDLSNTNVSELNQIRWIFDHEKMDESTVKTKVLAALQANAVQLQTLYGNGKLQSFFPNDRINSVESFISKLNNQNVFSTIFK